MCNEAEPPKPKLVTLGYSIFVCVHIYFLVVVEYGFNNYLREI